MGGIEREMSKVKAQQRQLVAGTDDYDKKADELRDSLKKLKEEQAAWKEEINGTNEELVDAGTAFGNLFNGLTSGNLTMAAAGLTSIKAAIIASTKAAWAFIATPIGMAIVALAGIALATKEWFNYNVEVAKANRETEAITKLSGQALNDARIQAKALSDTFEVDFKEVLETARALVNEFDISYTEALDRIQNGLVKGGAANGEFLESMREYPTFFAQAGFAIEEFQNLINTGIDLGIYSDKLPDAIKEFALSVTEQTPAVREALENAFGTEFTDKLLKGIKDGSITVKDALQQVSAEAQRLGLNAQQAQQLTADLFRGAGEDAGGAIKIFNAVTQSIENQKRPLSEVEQAVQDLTESEKALAQAQDDALRSDGFEVWANNVKIFLNDVKTGFYNLITVITNGFDELENQAERNAQSKAVKQWADDSLNTFKDYIERRKKSMGDLYTYEKVQEEYLQTVRQQLQNSRDKDEQEKLRAEIAIIESHGKQVRTVENNNDIEAIKAKKAANDKKLAELKAQHKREKDEADRAAKQAREAFERGEQEINALIAKAQQEREVAKLSGLQKEIKQIENKYAAEIEKFKEHTARLKELEAARDQEIADAKAAKAKEYGLQIDEINAQLERDREALRLDKEAAAATTDEEKQRILLEKAQMLADWELQSEMDKELAKVEEVENAEELKQAIRDKYAQKKLDNDQKFAEAEKNIKKDIVDWTKLTEEQKLQAIKGALNGASEAFNKGSAAWKAIKIAETTITTYQTAMEAYKALAGIPVVGPALGAAAAGLATVAGLKQIQNIANTKIAKAPKFFRGGYTGTRIFADDEFGGMTGVTHANEWVAPAAMTQNPRYANVIGWLEGERIKLNGGAAPSAPQTPGSPVTPKGGADTSTEDIKGLLTALLFRLDNPVAPVLAFGYQDVENLNEMNNEITKANRNGTLNS